MKKLIPWLTVVGMITQLLVLTPVVLAANEWTVVRGDPVNYSETGTWNVSASLNAIPGGAVKAATQQAALGDGTATFQLPADAPAGSYAIYYYAPAKTGSYHMQVNGTEIPFLFSSYYHVSAWTGDTQGAYLRLGGENYTFSLNGGGNDVVRIITNGVSNTAHSSSVKFIRVGDTYTGAHHYIRSDCGAYSAIPNETQPWPRNSYMYRDDVEIDGKTALRLHYARSASATVPECSQSTLPLLYPNAAGRVVFDASFRIDHIAEKNALLFRDGATNGIIAHIDFTSKEDGIHLNYYDGSTKATQSSSGTIFHEEQWYRMILVFDTTKPAYDIYCYDEENHRVEAVTGIKPKTTTLAAGNCSVHKIDIQLYHKAGQAVDTTMYFDWIKLFDGAGFEVPQGTPVIPTPDTGPFTSQRIELDPANAVGNWSPTTSFPDSTGAMEKSLYSSSPGDYVEYPTNLVPGWYDLYFWNLVYQDHQNPMKMTATVSANNTTKTDIPLPVNTTSADRDGRWDKIGTYYFAGGEGEYVRLVASGGPNARPADIKLEQNPAYIPPKPIEDFEPFTISCSQTGNTGNKLRLIIPVSEASKFPFDVTEGCMANMKISGTFTKKEDPSIVSSMQTSLIENNEAGNASRVGILVVDVGDTGFDIKPSGEPNYNDYHISLTIYSASTPLGPYTFQKIGLHSPSCTKEGAWIPGTMADSTGATDLGVSLYSNTAGDYVEYSTNLVPGWYDLYFWNIKYQTNQDPMKMTATVFANGQNRTGISLPVNPTSADREGRWDQIGTYYFAGGTDEFVRLVASGGDFARPSDIKLVQNPAYVPPLSLSRGETIANFDTDFPLESIPGYFKVYVQGEPGGFAQVDLMKNGALESGSFVTFHGEWDFLGSYKFDGFDTINFEQDILRGEAGLRKVKFEYEVPDKLTVESIGLHNESLGRTETYMQAGLHTVSAEITPVNIQSAMMVLGLFEDGRLKETAYARQADLKAGETVTITAQIPVASVSGSTVLKVMFWDSMSSLTPLSEVKTYFTDREERKAPYLISSLSFEDHMGTWSYSSDSASLNGKTLMGKTSSAPTEDATVEINTRKAGTYHIWVRSKNFASDPDSRYFNVKVNGTPLDQTFGQVGTDGFFWEDGGEVTLAQGINQIAVVDSSCHYARLDAIYMTQGSETPSNSYQELIADATLVSNYYASMTTEEMMMDFHITKDFPGGNVTVLAKNDNTVTLSPDLSDTTNTDWFYWNFKATSDTARTVTFKFDSAISAVLNSTGVVYSLDNGRNWNYLTDYKSPQREFKYEFEPGQQVWLSVTLPYVEKDLTNYIDTIKENPRVTVSTLCQSEEGRDVPLIVVGNPSAPKSIVFTSRHHCCEATASYLLEGAIDYLATEADARIFDTYCFYIVPMVDIDGVENGDQGKGRDPHDHNRDYVAGMYAPVRAIKELAAEKEIAVAIDFHCPYIPDKLPYLYLWNGAETEINKFGAALVTATRGDEIYYDQSRDFAAGDYYPQSMTGWFALNKAPRLTTSFEFPYAGDGIEYTPSNIRVFGRKTMMALLDYLYHE